MAEQQSVSQGIHVEGDTQKRTGSTEGEGALGEPRNDYPVHGEGSGHGQTSGDDVAHSDTPDKTGENQEPDACENTTLRGQGGRDSGGHQLSDDLIYNHTMNRSSVQNNRADRTATALQSQQSDRKNRNPENSEPSDETGTHNRRNYQDIHGNQSGKDTELAQSLLGSHGSPSSCVSQEQTIYKKEGGLDMKTEQQHGVDGRTWDTVEEQGNCTVTGGGEEENDGLQRKIRELEAKRTSQEMTIREIKEHETALLQQVAKNEQLQTELHDKTKRLEETEGNLEMCENAIKENEAKISAQSNDLATQKRKSGETQYKLQEATEKHDRFKKQTEGQIKRLTDEAIWTKQERLTLKDKNTGLEKEMKKKEKAAQDSQNKLKSEKEKLEKSNREFETKCKNASKKQEMIIVGLKKDAKDLQQKAKREAENCQKTSKDYYDALDRIRDLEEQVKDITQLHTDISHLQRDNATRNEEIQTLHTEMKALLEEKQRLSDSLSKEWSTKVSSDETNTENISVSNRPMMIKTEFENICSDEWLDAKTELDDRQEKDEDHRIMFLCDILMKAEKCARRHYDDKMTSLKLYLSQPLIHTVVPMSGLNDGSNTNLDKPESDTSQSSDTSQTLLKASPKEHKPAASLPLELKNALGDYLRITADNIDITQLTRDVNNQLKTGMKTDSPWIHDVLKNKVIQKYISVCSLLAWKMITQRPPMTFSNKGELEKYNEKTQEPHFGSDDPTHKDSIVMYFVTPALYHSDGLMVKGRVMMQILK